MTPLPGQQAPTTPTNQYDNAPSFPGLVRATTAPHGFPSTTHHRSYLAPEDAYVTSPPRHHSSSSTAHGPPPHPSAATAAAAASTTTTTTTTTTAAAAAARIGAPPYDSPDDRRGRSRSRRRRKKQYKKLLWVKQSYRDNYTDQATFLESLQRNPRLQPYQFWTLFSDSTVILQQFCAVTIFTVCFSLIFQERMSCSSVAAGGSFATFMGWVIWTLWEWREQDAAEAKRRRDDVKLAAAASSASSVVMMDAPLTRPGSAAGGGSSTNLSVVGSTPGLPFSRLSQSASMTSLGYTVSSSSMAPRDSTCIASGSDSASTPHHSHHNHHQNHHPRQRHHHRHVSHEPTQSRTHSRQPSTEPHNPVPHLSSNHSRQTSYDPITDVANLRRRSSRQGRWENLVGTIKSSVLIVFFVGAVSPILKSLTRSFASDSIWAMSSFLLLINLFFFDYSIGITPPAATGVGASVGASIAGFGAGGTSGSTIAGMPRSGPAAFALNSATMASTVLASRLPQTSQVFSLTIFSMEMFALFPIFRRYARHHSLPAHVMLTTILIVGAGGGAGVAFGSPEDWVRNAARGTLISVLSSVIAMGGCSYWLISLQKYKNAIIGPWDPARPVITGPGALARMHFQED